MDKVLSFIEWVDKRKQKLLEDLQVLQNSIMPMNSYEEREKLFKQFVVDLTEAHDFYNQKFDVSFLVNPIDLCNQKFEDIPVWKLQKYEQSEQLRYFEGWKRQVSEDLYGYEYKFNSLTVEADIYFKGSNENPELRFFCYDNSNGKEIFMPFETLNDFITLCKLAGIELTWNPNNQTIINLNLNQ